MFHSAKVEMWFVVNGIRVPVASCGRGSMTVPHPWGVSEGEFGEIVILVDGKESRRNVRVTKSWTVCEVEGVE